MSRHLVCLTFDFDAMSGFAARGLVTATPVSRGEFGAVGADRILALLQRHSIRATWFVPGVVIGTYPAICERVVAAGHEVGHHGWSHIPPAELSRDKEAEDLGRGNEAIRGLTGAPAQGYRSPSWDLSANSIELLLDQGFAYDSSMMGHDYMPYRARVGDVAEAEKPMVFGRETCLVEMPISWSLDDFPHFEFLRTPGAVLPGLADARGVLSNWIDDFLYMKQTCDWGVITYTCHPYVIGRGHRMMMLERLILRLLEEGALFITMADAVKEFESRQSARG